MGLIQVYRSKNPSVALPPLADTHSLGAAVFYQRDYSRVCAVSSVTYRDDYFVPWTMTTSQIKVDGGAAKYKDAALMRNIAADRSLNDGRQWSTPVAYSRQNHRMTPVLHWSARGMTTLASADVQIAKKKKHSKNAETRANIVNPRHFYPPEV
ncbi:hypothetical protein LshimejAT787_1103120 [Lyophyllum shimeji]|uniref:Uncharacterized protein n=1 Tax=Lyophyllum shimeji TaxID=47721 RepID=A0A9P3URJ4_LYOSH|nr:hypothetical protein LshimejAT787_1103120 [Lyophyllum shimeji]